jgi:hypothetical protein
MTTTHAGWVADSEHARILYSEQSDKGHATFTEAVSDLAITNRIQSLDGITASALFREDAFQKELFGALERDSPRKLREALKSAGNNHNPKMIQLWEPFKKAVLATPTVKSMNDALAPYYFKVTGTSFEELGIQKGKDGARFYGFLWLTVTKLSRSVLFGDETAQIRSAKNIRAEEFIDTPTGEHTTLSKFPMSHEFAVALAAVIDGKEFLEEPKVEDQAMCFNPHHSIDYTTEAGVARRMFICFECRKFTFGPPDSQSIEYTFTAAADQSLRKLFADFKIPIRTDAEYISLYREHHAAK